jgi:hypothetical protein
VFGPGQDASVFGRREDQESRPRLLKPDILSLGQWTAVSGAAVSTGLGSMSSIPFSFLLGFSNLRLGYWWQSDVDAATRAADAPTLGRRAGRLLRAVFPVQKYLLDELTATFHGIEEPRWYLTDGGHFENMGAYELVRRRLPLIVVVDAEADPDYACGGLANLVRKARMDFGTEIEFLDSQALDQGGLSSGLRAVAGPLDALSPGPEGRSTARVALARLRYPEGAPGWLVYLKPTLRGNEPADLREYRACNPEFPQQTTADQFFDEAQWESYRKLGEHIGSEVFPQMMTRAERGGEPPSISINDAG